MPIINTNELYNTKWVKSVYDKSFISQFNIYININIM
jgi:hypothetical protein